MIVDDAVAGVVALVNLHTGDVATAGATAETAAVADGSSSAPPPFVAPIYMENLDTAGNASEGMFDFLRAAPPLPVDLDEDEELPVDVGEGEVLEIAAMDSAADVVLAGIDDVLEETTAHAVVEDPMLKQLQDRLDEEGLSFEDLRTSDDIELNILLEELGFKSAVLRAKMRKAMRAQGLV